MPVTLELGGKCPAILTADSVDAQSVRSVIGTKLIKNGQMRISVDYALVPRAQVDEFVAHAEGYAASELGGLRDLGGTAPGSSPSATSSESRRCWIRPGHPERGWSRLAATATVPPGDCRWFW